MYLNVCWLRASERSEHTVVLSLTTFLSVCQSVCLCVQGCIQNFILGEETFKLKKNTVELIVAHAQYKWNFNDVSNAFFSNVQMLFIKNFFLLISGETQALRGGWGGVNPSAPPPPPNLYTSLVYVFNPLAVAAPLL